MPGEVKKNVLIIDDEIHFCKSLTEILESEGLTAFSSTNPSRALQIIRENDVDLIFLDVKMPGQSGIELLRGIKARDPGIPIIMITGYPSVDNIVQSMKMGASTVFAKPPNIDELIRETKTLLDSRNQKRTGGRAVKPRIITQNKTMGEVLKAIARIAPIDAPVLITGESGTGKELCANAIHELSQRKEKPFVKVNSAAIPETLMESELFGHEKGAFTDAVSARQGRFELADGGTIFLDEIADMTLNNQAKILRVLQEKEFERVGGSRVISTDIRIVAATSKNLPRLIQSGRFREDLYYRLSVITLEMIPLRERRDDILLLAQSFIDHFNEVYAKRIADMSDEVRRFLLHHDWPGNVRELRNCMERAVIFCETNVISRGDLPSQYHDLIDTRATGDYQQASAIFNRDIILDALERSKGRKAKAAELLRINRRTLYNRMKRLGL